MLEFVGENYTFLSGLASDQRASGETDLLARWTPVGRWFHERGRIVRDPFQKVAAGRILPYVSGALRDGTPFSGVNFASQDYLSLASHPEIVASAHDAATEFGVHSAGSAALMGASEISQRLEHKLEQFLGYRECTLFPTGWTAGFGIVKMLVGRGDHVLIDVLAHACLQEGADASGATVHRYPHVSNEAVERRLVRLREVEPNAGILVVTETLFSMDSDTPDFRELQALCRTYGATLVVDCAHDLGSFGETGRGVLELQGMIGAVDVLIGTFSKTFASIGGFVATQREGFRTAMRACCGAQTFTNAMTPLQAAVVLRAIEIVEGPEGTLRRRRLMQNIEALRTGLIIESFEVLGQPSAIVPVVVGTSPVARLMTSHMLENGAIVNLVEAPAVARNRSRWRLQVMADHEPAHIHRLVEVAVQARRITSEALV